MNELFKEVTLLYVEDDESIRPIFERVLKRKMKKLFVACDGLEGYEMFKEFKPDMILTDIKMPKMNGLEMAKKIRETNQHIPIIILSAHSEGDFFLEAIEIGISGYLVKPIDKEKLFNLLERNAKITLFERNKKEQEELLQNVIDMQASIVFLGNKNKNVLFVNKLFLDFFLHNSDDPMEHIYEELKQINNVKLLDINEDIFWIDYIFLHPNEVFKISVSKNETNTELLVKTKQVINENDTENVIVITITQL